MRAIPKTITEYPGTVTPADKRESRDRWFGAKRPPVTSSPAPGEGVAPCDMETTLENDPGYLIERLTEKAVDAVQDLAWSWRTRTSGEYGYRLQALADSIRNLNQGIVNIRRDHGLPT